MNINISEFFAGASADIWNATALKTLKLDKLEDLERKLSSASVEGFNKKTYYNMSSESLVLKSFPILRNLGRVVQNLDHTIDEKNGLTHFFTNSKISVSADSTLIQNLDNLESKIFSKNIHINVYKIILEQSKPFSELQNFLDSLDQGVQVSLSIPMDSIHNAGGSIVQELSYGLSLALLTLERIPLGRIVFNVSCDSLYFTNIAKLRALRFLWERVLEENNLDLNNFEIITHNSKREQTLFDPWVNMLRASAGSAAALIGGADTLTSFSYDSLIDDYELEREKGSIGQRQSRNILHILLEESSLANVLDPGAGSYTIESLSLEFTKLAYEKSLSLNLVDSLPAFAKEVELTARIREEALKRRKLVLAGVNDFANTNESIGDVFAGEINLDEKDEVFPLRRVSTIFEKLRISLHKKIKLAPIKVFAVGTEAKLSARIMFCKNYFEILGVDVEVSLSSLDELNLNVDSVSAIVICAEDKNYETIFEKLDTPEDLPCFIAGKAFEKEGWQNIYARQNLLKVLNDSFGAKI